jgi:hypothetical protein
MFQKKKCNLFIFKIIKNKQKNKGNKTDRQHIMRMRSKIYVIIIIDCIYFILGLGAFLFFLGLHHDAVPWWLFG